ncbi:hypothetical protein ACWGDE_13085 [Streptomyces sp. NPDC054956]
MTYNLLTVDAIRTEVMAAALAGCLGMAVGDVEIVDPDGDPDVPNWHAPVRPSEAEVAAGLAKGTATTVLFPAVEAPPSAYWAATPEGLLTRARLEPSDDEPPLFEVTAVEAAFPQLPHAIVTRFDEIVREHRPPNPVAEAFKASVGERVIVQMESGWAPFGWYPAGLYRERLEARDQLAVGRARLPHEVAELLDKALEGLDRRFVAATEPDPSGSLRRELKGASAEPVAVGWWWQRRPHPTPWGEV